MKLATRLLIMLVLIALVCTIADAYAVPLRVMSVQARGGLNVRTAPSVEATSVYVLEDTETVIVLEWRDGWAQVAKNNGDRHPIGWVCGDYLK